jgi:hypothetical protein
VKLVEGVIVERVDAFDLRDGEIEGEEVRMDQGEMGWRRNRVIAE